MITAIVFKESPFPIPTKTIKSVVTNCLESHGVVSNFSVEISLVGTKTMLEIGEKYYKEEEKGIEHPIFTFPAHETKGEFQIPPNDPPSLGEIYISYPWVVENAKEENKTPEAVVIELLEHGCLHLLGIHH